MHAATQANLYALGAIVLWAVLASLGVTLRHVPPFLLTGIALVIGSVPAWPLVARNPRLWAVAPSTLALGVYGLFGAATTRSTIPEPAVLGLALMAAVPVLRRRRR